MNIWNIFNKFIALAVLILLCIPITSVADTFKPEVEIVYQMGVFPFLPPRELEKIFAPYAGAIGKALGKKVIFQSTKTYRDFMTRSDARKYDIVFVQPFDYIRLADKKGYLPLASRHENLSALLVAKSGSEIKTIADLKGKIIAMPPAVAAVSRLAKNLLKENGLVDRTNITITHNRSHASCLQQVLIEIAAICVSAAPPIRYYENKMKIKFKIILRTKEIPHTLFAVHSRIPAFERKIILDTILSWNKSIPGRAMLKRGRMKPFKEIMDKDYDIVRKLANAQLGNLHTSLPK